MFEPEMKDPWSSGVIGRSITELLPDRRVGRSGREFSLHHKKGAISIPEKNRDCPSLPPPPFLVTLLPFFFFLSSLYSILDNKKS